MAEFIGKVGLSSDLSSTPIDEGFLLSTDDGALYLDYKDSDGNKRYNIVPKKVDNVKKVTLESGAIIKVTTQDGQSEYYSIPTMGAASASAGGTKGLVPESAAGDQAKYLRADGTWAEVTGVHNFTITNDTTSAQIVTQLNDYPDSIFSVNITNINGCTLTGMASVSIEDISGNKTVSVACGNYVIAQIASSESVQDAITGGRVYLISNSFSTILALQNLVSELEGKLDSLAIADVSGLQNALDGKAASTHTHAIGDVTDLQTTLDGKAASTHTHAISDVTNLQGSLDGKLSTTGTAAAANKLATARTITLGSDCSGSVSFDGSTNVTLNVTVKDDSHNHTIANVDNLQSQLNTISSNASSAKTVTDKYSAMLNIIGNNQ